MNILSPSIEAYRPTTPIRRLSLIGIVGLASVLPSASCAAASFNCETPLVESQPFAGDPQAAPDKPETWTHAIHILAGSDPATRNNDDIGKFEVAFTYRDPGNNLHTSKPTQGEAVMRIGPNSIRFGAKLIYDRQPVDPDKACNTPPLVVFEQTEMGNPGLEGAVTPQF